MKKIYTNTKAKEVLINLNEGNTVLFLIHKVEMKKENHLVYMGIPVTMKKGFLTKKEPKTGRVFTEDEFIEPIIGYVFNSVQSKFNVELEGISYQPICFDHKLTGEELTWFETEMKAYFSKNPPNKN
jgi:hypothetical protein